MLNSLLEETIDQTQSCRLRVTGRRLMHCDEMFEDYSVASIFYKFLETSASYILDLLRIVLTFFSFGLSLRVLGGLAG